MQSIKLSLLAALSLYISSSQELKPGIAAQFEGGSVSVSQLNEFLLQKYGKKEEGEGALQHHIQLLLVDKEAKRRHLIIGDKQLEKKIQELEAGIKQANPNSSLEAELKSKQISFQEFSDLLRISIEHERMAREDLGIQESEAINPAQLNLWLTDREKKASIVKEGPSLTPGAVATVDGTAISVDEFGATLRRLVGRKATRAALFEMIGPQLLFTQGKAMGIEIQDKDVDEEIARRRARLTEDPQLKGVSYEEILKAQGTTLEELRASTKFRAGLLMGKIAQHIYTDDSLEESYKRDREKYEGRYGESRKVSWIFIRGVKFPNQFVKRSLEDAEKELQTIREKLKDPSDFARLAKLYSEDDKSKDSGGAIGYLHRAEPDFDSELLKAIFAAKEKEIIGPLRIAQGAVLVYVEENKPAPAHKEILNRIREELRAEYYNECLKNAKIVTFLDEGQ